MTGAQLGDWSFHSHQLPWFAGVGYVHRGNAHKRNWHTENAGRLRFCDRVLALVQFIQLVVIAFIIAAPIAWWAVDQWLHEFAYRTSMSWWVFAASGLMLIFALITLAIQTVKTARANPVESLRVD